MAKRNNDFFFGAWADLFGPKGLNIGMGRFRIFDRGDLKYVILELLSRKPMHGYEVMRALEQESNGCYSASPGSVYPTLQMLQDQGFVTCEEKEGKKTYSITDEGHEFLKQNGDILDDIVCRVTDFTDRFFRTEMRDLTASFKDLARVTFDRATHWSDPEALQRMKEILDRATEEMKEAASATREQAKQDGGNDV